jgi:hypothetical protein
VLGRAGHDRDMLVAQFAIGKGLLRLRQVFQLPGDAHPFRRRPTRELAVRAQPRHQVERPVSRILPRLTEAPKALSEDAFQAVLRLSRLNQSLAQRSAIGIAHGGRVVANRGHQSGSGPFQPIGCRHDAIVNHGCDSCLSQTLQHF